MSRRLLFLFVGILGTLFGSLVNNLSVAQIVDFWGGGVHVRAPFVRVDVFPYGGVSVRAPFAAVDVPNRRYRYYPEGVVAGRPNIQPVMPTAQEMAAMDDEALFRLLHFNASQLQRELDRFNTGSEWQRYLHVSDGQREELGDDLLRFRKIASNAEYGMISSLPAFRATEAVLTELASRANRPPNASRGKPEDLPLPPPARNETERSLLPGATK